MKKQIKFIATATALLAFTQAGHAASINWTGGGTTDDWNDTANWGGVTPGSQGVEDSVIFNTAGDNNTPTASFAFTTASDFNFRNEATLTLQTGVTISNFDQGRLAANGGNGGGHVVQTGGTLSGRTFVVASSLTATTRSSHTMSGGNVTLTELYEVNTLGDVILTGSTAAVSAGSIDFEGNSTLTFNFDAAGIGSFTTAGSFGAGTTSTMTINVGSYNATVGAAFTLVDAATLTGFDSGNITVNGFGTEGVGYTLTQDLAGSGDIVFTVIPEPGTYALLAGLTGLAFVMLRRRRS
ncbi:MULTISPECIES: PEP-CTERM sorting domain-containing protein [unclassified Lentimonas]|uniref:PEP-CTERM sorting domain-containing protein n=1 Tax=unclassified Lentimonas TaxID=2630993 RepID=UPI001327E7BA|nr:MULTISPECIES: PEP-CTERM sorting domain-containing protein [unclassified Lentimonas]CAA6676304.1 Unannotated [Lentimonas sp. CC4]CAA6683806.1 Unannotated [Lentimonas sp. CC6]CAA7077797.1 Unannotated [Lentimonas sp. CC4]CAA7169729.1 Unannotated [Lentimonas sp. CC21]CAA7179551.1 Unannotated [Lentimonas sp. CC8]